MSLIADALKTAQRERERRASHEGPSAAAVLIPLREPRFRLRPRATLTVVGIAVIAVAATIIVRRQGARERLPALSPTSTILSDAIADSTREARPLTTPRRTDAAAPANVPPRTTTAPAQAVGVARDTATILQGQPDSLRLVGTTDVPAAGELRVAVVSRPSAERLFSQAVAAQRSGDVITARALYQRVLSVAPDHADALNNFGVILSGEQEYDGALEVLQRAAGLAPGNAGTWSNIGTALREQGKSHEAIAAFRHALNVDPRHQGARVGLAQQYVAIGVLSDARTLLQQVIAINPSLAEAHYTLGQVLEREGDRPGAIRAYTTFVTVAPPRLAAHAERVRQYLETLSR